MARIRAIKPGFFFNEDLAGVPAHGRLLFIGLWTLADRQGRLEDRPLRIRAQVFAYEPEVDVEALLGELAARGFIVRYEVEGERYLQVVNWERHQRPNSREEQSRIPPCWTVAELAAVLGRDSGSAPHSSLHAQDEHGENLARARTCTHVQGEGEGKGKEQEGNSKGEGEQRERAGRAEADAGEEPDGPDLEAYRSAVLELHPRPGLPIELERELWQARGALPPLAEFRSALEAWAACEQWREGFAEAAPRWLRGRGWKGRPPGPRRAAPRGDVPHLGPRPVAEPVPELDVAGRIAALVAALPAGIPGREGLVEGLAMAERAGAKEGPEAAEHMLEALERGYLGRMARGELGDVEAAMRAEQVVDQARAMVGPNRLTDAALEAMRHQALAAELGLPKLTLFGPREVAA